MTEAQLSPGHMATVEAACAAERAYRFLVDPERIGGWALGCWQAETVEPGLFRGRSLFDRSEIWGRIDADPERMVVDYHVGAAPDRLTPRIMARVVPGPVAGRPEGVCLVSLVTWRVLDMDEARWHRLRMTHEAEVLLIAGQLAGLAKDSPDE